MSESPSTAVEPTLGNEERADAPRAAAAAAAGEGPQAAAVDEAKAAVAEEPRTAGPSAAEKPKFADHAAEPVLPPPVMPRAKAAESEARRTYEAMNGEREREPPPLEPERTLRDVTEPLRFGSPKLDAATEDVSQWVTHLRRERVLVLASASQDVLEAALRGIADSEALRSHTRKARLLLGKSLSRSDSFELCCLPDFDDNTADGAEVLLVVEATHDSARDFLDDLFRDPITQRAARIAELRRLSRHVLVLTTADLLSERDQGFGHGGSALPCLRLPFHRQLIAHVFSSEDDATRAQLIASFEAQRDAGSWGATEQEQYRTFHARCSGHTLRAKLDAGVFGAPAEPVTIGADVLVGTLLFVACFLTELSPHDFQVVLLQLLGDEPDPTWRAGAAGETPRLSRQRWVAQSQALLASAGLAIGPSTKSKGKQQLLFSDGNLDARKSAFRSQQPFLLESYRRKLEQDGLLFDGRVTLAESFSAFLAESAAHDQSLDADWLLELLAPALAEDLAPSVASARLEACRRALRDLLAKGCTAVVEGYLERLCQRGRHDILLQIGQRLTSAHGFDELVWLKRCLDQGTAEVAERAHARLLSIALRPGARVLERSSGWLSKTSAGPSRSQLALLRLCVELSELPIWAPSLSVLMARRAPCLTEPAALLVILELSFSHHVEATLNEQGRWLFELKKLIDVWFVPDAVAELLAETASLLRFHLLGVWLQSTGHDHAIPPHLGVLQAISLAGAALCLPVEAGAHLRREAQRVLLGLPRQQRDAVELRLRAIEQCFTEVALWLDRSQAARSHEPARRERWRATRAVLAEQRVVISAFRASKHTITHQPRNRENAKPD